MMMDQTVGDGAAKLAAQGGKVKGGGATPG